MKIRGVEINKKTIIIVAGVIGFIILICVMSSSAEKKKKQAALDEAKQNQPQEDYVEQTTEQLTHKEELINMYGEPPEGYMWNDDGELYAIGSDDLNSEEVIYSYIRALSILDFSSAGKYTKYNTVIKRYRNYYEDDGDYSAYREFLRKQMKLSMESLEVNEIKSEAVFEDGTKIVNVAISCIDLSDKEFYKPDEDEIFSTLRTYFEEDRDSIRSQQYLLEYMYDKYADGTVPKREQEIELVLEKNTDGGWVISNENELMFAICYEDGEDVYNYILEDYNDWVERKHNEEEQEEERQRQAEEAEAERQRQEEEATATEEVE